MKFTFNSNVKSVELFPGVRRKILNYCDNLMVCEVHFEKGRIAPMHNHPHEQSTYVKSGVCKATIGEESHILHAGDCIIMEPNEEHEIESIEETVVIDIFSPMRKDFLEKE